MSNKVIEDINKIRDNVGSATHMNTYPHSNIFWFSINAVTNDVVRTTCVRRTLGSKTSIDRAITTYIRVYC
jgi:hypothetical protein